MVLRNPAMVLVDPVTEDVSLYTILRPIHLASAFTLLNGIVKPHDYYRRKCNIFDLFSL